jgi:hypothetical protein
MGRRFISERKPLGWRVGHSPCAGLQILIICPELSGGIANPEQRDYYMTGVRKLLDLGS